MKINWIIISGIFSPPFYLIAVYIIIFLITVDQIGFLD